jgi:hypothetical protein
MRRTASVALLVFLAAALGMWMSFSSKQVKSTAPQAEASLTTILPVEFMRKSEKDLPDKTVPEPF